MSLRSKTRLGFCSQVRNKKREGAREAREIASLRPVKPENPQDFRFTRAKRGQIFDFTRG